MVTFLQVSKRSFQSPPVQRFCSGCMGLTAAYGLFISFCIIIDLILPGNSLLIHVSIITKRSVNAREKSEAAVISACFALFHFVSRLLTGQDSVSSNLLNSARPALAPDSPARSDPIRVPSPLHPNTASPKGFCTSLHTPKTKYPHPWKDPR